MTTLKKRRNREWMEKRVKRAARGYPIGTIAFYGPTNQVASKVAVGVILKEDEGAQHIQRWFSDNGDIRKDVEIQDRAIRFLKEHGVRSVAMT